LTVVHFIQSKSVISHEQRIHYSNPTNLIQIESNIHKVDKCSLFVAAEVDESTDVTNKVQISVIMWLKARWLVK